MKIYKTILLCISISMMTMIQFTTITIATNNANRRGSPMQILDNFANEVNKDTKIQDNALNDITNQEGQYASEFKITNTLDSIRIQIAPYIQWTMYLGLSMAVAGIIYNGFLMVTNSLHGNGETEKVKERIMNLSIGVGLLTGFYVIIQILLAAITYLQK